MDIYMTMMEKIVETGNMYYYLVNYDEYLRLIFSNPLMGAWYVISAASVVFLVLVTIPAFVIGIKMIKVLVKEFKTTIE